ARRPSCRPSPATPTCPRWAPTCAWARRPPRASPPNTTPTAAAETDRRSGAAGGQLLQGFEVQSGAAVEDDVGQPFIHPCFNRVVAVFDQPGPVAGRDLGLQVGAVTFQVVQQ